MPPTTTKPTKQLKRPASSQAGPNPKKPHLDNSAKRPGVAKDHLKPKLKSRRPVTDDHDSESGDSSDNEEEVSDKDASHLDQDPNGHKAQRALHHQRRASKPHSSILSRAKVLWASARQKNVSAAERKEHIRALMDVIRNNVKDLVFKHDASRIVQTVVKYGGQKDRDEVAVELKGHYKELAQNKYSKFLVTKLLRLCPTHRASILSEFQSHVIRLLMHREASSVVADAYELYSNAYERSILLRDFYGKETLLFTVTTGSEESKERAKKGLKGVLEGLEGERRKRVLAALKENLTTVFNNSDKGAVAHAIVHRALWEYLVVVNETPEEKEREVLWREIWECCQDSLAEMVHTKDGSRAAREFLARGSAKDRKLIVKAIKPHVKRICQDDEAQLVLFTALDAIDDTKLTGKSLVVEVISHAEALCETPQGRRALLYLLVPRTKRHFTPAQIAVLAETDSIKIGTSKKDDNVREEEIRKSASEGLLTFVAEKGDSMSRTPGGSLVITEIMLYAQADKTAATDALLAGLKSVYPSEDPERPHPIDLPHTSRMFKTLLQGGHFSRETQSVTLVPTFSAGAFASALMKQVGQDLTLKMGTGNGAFVVAELCERIRIEGAAEERATLKSWFKAIEMIERCDAKGKRVLLESVSKLGR